MVTSQTDEELAPPEFLQLAGHPLRWRLLSELARSDRRVGELYDLAGQRQSLVSVPPAPAARRRPGLDAAQLGRRPRHLLRPRPGALRRAAVGAGAALHPGLGSTPPPPRRAGAGATARVLFLCTGNSARSQMAEALAEQLSGGAVRAASAGSHPKPLHPNAVRVMRERGIDLAGRRSKHLERVRRPALRLRDQPLRPRARGLPRVSRRHRELIHWSIPDPAREPGADDETLPAFERTAAELETRIGFLIEAIEPTTTDDQEVTEHA